MVSEPNGLTFLELRLLSDAMHAEIPGLLANGHNF